jgi:arylsulfatase B
MKPFLPIFLLFITSVSLVYADSKPNILIMVADDLGYADVGFNGGKVIATPNLDQLAATGVNLTDFHSCPMCSPTRAGLMTGRWPIRFGMMRAVVPPWSDYGLPSSEVTLAESLERLGYAHRGITGKWHLGHSNREQLPLAHGFNRFVGHYNGAIDYFTHEREGETDWHHDYQSVKVEGYSTDLIADEAVRFVSDSQVDKPWLLYIPFNAPHSPYQAKESDLKKYPQLKMANRRAYAAMVDSMDQAIGRIFTALDSQGATDNTLVLFFSDNGGIPKVGSSNAPFRGAKLTVYEGGTRVCAAIRWPQGGLTGGKKFDGRIGYVDVLPTVVSVAGGEVSSDIDGVNFIPAVLGESELPQRPWFSYMHQNEDAHASVHLGQWKLVAHGDFFSKEPNVAPELELYDLSKDVSETQNVAELNPAIVKDLHSRLREFGTWQKPGVAAYDSGRADFNAPKDWNISN